MSLLGIGQFFLNIFNTVRDIFYKDSKIFILDFKIHDAPHRNAPPYIDFIIRNVTDNIQYTLEVFVEKVDGTTFLLSSGQTEVKRNPPTSFPIADHEINITRDFVVLDIKGKKYRPKRKLWKTKKLEFSEVYRKYVDKMVKSQNPSE